MTSYLYGYQTPSQRLTLDELELRSTWRFLDPEFKRRLVALFDASQFADREVGIGGGWRSSAQQEALFRSRYTSAPVPPGILWNGTWWTIKPGVASSAPPGRSYHETSTAAGAVAADLIGDIAWAGTVAHLYGLVDLSDVNDEPWHFQPVEIPIARRNFNGQPLKPYPLPAPPDEEVDDMLEYVLVPKGGDTQPWWPWLACYTSGAVRPLGPGGANVPHITVTDIGQYRRICHAASIQLATEMPA